MTPQIALSRDFLAAYSRLPKHIQKKVREFTEKFQRDPTGSSLNFERVVEARDNKVRSVRIDQAYRAIVVQPPKGDVFLCVWVDHHDEAYRWARDRCFEVNPRVGSFQIYEVNPGELAAAPKVARRVAAKPVAAGLLDAFDDEDLLLAGVPQPLLAAVRALKAEDDLDRLAPHLPPDAAEILYALAAGYSVMDAIEESARKKPEPAGVDVENFQQAFEQPQSKSSFAIVSSERELEDVLNAPLEQWRVFLHPTQRALVEMHAGGPVRVLGGAGTGKTVVLMHRARHLLAQVFTGEDDRILVTTYTRNLAHDLEQNLRQLCPEEVGRLEVANLHAWAIRFMRQQGHEFAIVTEENRRLWMASAVDELATEERPPGFYLDEWDRVVLAQEVTDRDGYLSARRIGRGTRLRRSQRAAIWKVFEGYRERLNSAHQVEWADVIREARLYIERQAVSLPYRAVLCDEVQDLPAGELRLLRRVAPEGENSLFLVGDGHQRIYGQPVRLGACGIEIRGRSRRLKLNYRTTEQIRALALATLEACEIDDLDGGVDTAKGYRSLRSGPPPQVRLFTNQGQEAKAVVAQLREWLKVVPAEAICVSARTKRQIKDRYQPVLTEAGIDSVIIEGDPKGAESRGGVRLATMHRMKGLEFARVLLAGVQAGTVPQPIVAADGASAEDRELEERCLLYVAMTRARDELVLTGFGKPSPLLRGERD